MEWRAIKAGLANEGEKEMSNKAYVTGVGMVPFQKPGKSESYDVMAAAATNSALKDAGLDYGKNS